ncbi:MAG: hypothetical protein D6714_19120 [Bacteroidetes bacterium]|nr:MAG: hypothetical protein D6714_19120 [Bacteroidota bacterium]
MKYLFFLFALASMPACFGQKFIQIEKLNAARTRKIFVGSEVTFQLTDGQWYTRTLEGVNYDKQLLLFPSGHVAVSDVAAIRSFKNRRWSNNLGNQLIAFAPVWGGYTLVASAIDDEIRFGRSDFVIMGSAVLSGILTKLLFKQRTFYFQKNQKPSSKWRLRALDLDIENPNRERR